MQAPHRPLSYSAPKIPPELSDRIIDYLHADARTLSVCGLTCRDWLPRVRYNRFKKLEIDATSCRGLLQLLSRTPDIGAIVRNLAICYRTYNRIGRSQRTTWDAQTLAALLCKLPCVERLQLDTIDVHASVAHVIQEYVPNVQALILTRVHVEHIGVLYELYLALPHLQELQIVDLFLIHTNATQMPDLAPNRRTAPTLTKLRFASRILGDTVAPTFISWLLSHGLQGRIDTLQIPDVCRDDLLAVTNLLRSVGPTLRHLSINFASSVHGTAIDNPHGTPSLTHCTALYTLGLCINLMQDATVQERPMDMQPLSWVPSFFESISSPFLEHIHLRIKAGGATYEDMTHLDWARVADVLAGHQFSSLRRLTFEIIRGTNLQHAIVPYIKQRVAGLNRCGRVHMRFLQRT